VRPDTGMLRTILHVINSNPKEYRMASDEAPAMSQEFAATKPYRGERR
jgi:hypothetical protein